MLRYLTLSAALAAAMFHAVPALAAPVIVSPADYETVKTVSDKLYSDIHSQEFLAASTYAAGSYTSTFRQTGMAEYRTNSLPVRFVWSGASGSCTLRLWRSRDLAADPGAAPVFTNTTSGSSAVFFDPEVGRNYTWTVTDASGTATGHFFTEQRAPRLIYSDQDPSSPGSECSMGRDLGGWVTEDGAKVVRQGLVYRSAEFEYCAAGAEDACEELHYLKDVVGIKLDIDLRSLSHMNKNYVGTYWHWTWGEPAVDQSNIGPGVPRFNVNAVCGTEFPSYNGFTSTTANKKAVWCAFTNFCDTARLPAIFHCSHGKDRTGSLAYVLLGALGVAEVDARRDFGLTWYGDAKSDVDMSGGGYSSLYGASNSLYNKLPAGATFQARCEAYLLQCGTAAGLTSAAAQAKIDAFKAILLEDLEAPAAAPEIVSPADFATVSAMSPFLKAFKDSAAMVDWHTYQNYGTPEREAYEKDYKYTNGFVRLEWSGTRGPATVTVTRVRDGAVVFTTTTGGSSALFTDPEIGRNYSWTVTDGSSSATGRFYVERNAPRIIAYKGGDGIRHLVNGRDMGGWTNTAGKVVRQGRVYRSAMTELCSMDNPKDAQDRHQPLDYLRDVLGIRLDVDLRATSDTWLNIFINNWTWTWPQGLKISPIAPGIPRFHSEDACGACFVDYKYANAASTGPSQTAQQNRAAMWHTFTNFCQEANMPILYHCMWGKDRTGTLGYILLGVLGVPRVDLNRDWGLSWYAVSDESFVLSRWEIDEVYNFLQNYSGGTLAAKCESYLLACASDAGVGAEAAQALVAQYKALMLEDPEAPAVNPDSGDPEPEEPEPDVFTYKDFYFRRHAGGGTLGSNDDNGRLRYFYKSLTSNATSNRPFYSDMGYDCCYYFWPTASLPYACPVCGYYKAGKIVTNAANAAPDRSMGPYNLKAYFTTDGHTSADRTIIEHRAGVADYENVDLYFTVYDESKLGENNLGAAYVYSGTAAIEVWANATMRVRDMRDMSQKHKSAVKYKAYVKFPAGNCANARFEALETDTGTVNLLGWFTGGQAGTTQRLKVGSALLQFNATGKTSGVEGALVLEFELGSVNTTSSAAMLKVAGTLNVNAGSSVVVDAGGKGPGTYRLVQAGTLTDNANLPASATVSNCKAGYAGTVVRSGNNLNLVIAEEQGIPPAPVTDETVFDEHPDWGYKVSGLGASRGETALVFTNQRATAAFIMSDARENVRFLVVGGGGGGGADLYDDVRQGGGGGGGGGVVTGIVAQVAKDAVLTVSVGAGGEGGVMASKRNGNYGASSAGAVSSFAVDGTVYVTALGGGADGGSGTSTAYIGNAGGAGGSSAGSRPGNGTRTAAADTSSCINASVLANIPAYGVLGNPGGTGNTVSFYGYYLSAGGGGGATEAGGDGAAFDEANAATSSLLAGRGGEGLASDITGALAVYGSGGGGGSVDGGDEPFWPKGSRGGTGAGDGNFLSPTDSGTDARPNQGGGGGGGGRGANGGNGGSGIVVLRFVSAAAQPVPVAPPSVSPPSGTTLTANGTEQKPTVTPASDAGYTVGWGETDWTSAGSHTLTITPNSGYAWTDGSTAPIVYTYTFLPAIIGITLFDEHPEWGYKVEGLGAGCCETALVFTNQAAAMSWTVPADLENVQFLVVGGGGGGGGDVKYDDVRQAGAGGGGGGVVTGVVAQISKDAAVTVAVGAGGAGGLLATKRGVNYGAAADGGASSFAVGGVTYVTALGGGGDRGSASQNASGNAGGAGGSSAGSRPGSGTHTAAASTASCVNASALANIPAYGVLGNAGGAGNTVKVYDYYWNAGGGGGATEPGGDAALYDENDWDASFWGGKGGEGLASDITGTTAVYGSGGGGGSIYLHEARGGTGGTGAGNGNLNATTGSGTSALPNQGGGGGGGGRKANGGNGGSGIVVLRFRVPGVVAAQPQVDGADVTPAEIFTKARVAKPIVYPSEPTVTGDIGSQVISFGGADVNVPAYYTATQSGTTISLALNANAVPEIASEGGTPAFVVVDGKVRIHIANVWSPLYYAVLTATSLGAVNWTPCGAAEQGQDDFEYNAVGPVRFYKVSVRDEAE